MTAGLSVNSRYEPKNSRRSDTQIPSSLNSYVTLPSSYFLLRLISAYLLSFGDGRQSWHDHLH